MNNVNANAGDPDETTNGNGNGDSYVSEAEKTIRERIVHILTVYPKISVSMLQIGVGTSLAPRLWKPVLEQLITEGIVVREQLNYTSPTGREQLYTSLKLSTTN